jgi:hypothetical protein
MSGCIEEGFLAPQTPLGMTDEFTSLTEHATDTKRTGLKTRYDA